MAGTPTLRPLFLLAAAALLFGQFACGEEDPFGDCTDDAECGIGQSCTDGTCASNGEAVATRALGTVNVNTDSTGTVEVNVPAGSESLAVVLEGAGSRLILASKITAPSGTVVYDWNADIFTNRTDATDGLYTVMVPTNPEVEVESGTWTFSFLTDGDAFDATATGIVKTESASANAIDLNLFFVGVDGLDAATAETNADFQEILSNVGSIYAGAGISLGTITYEDVTGDAATRFSTIDSTESPDGELYELFSLSAGKTGRSMNFFFVADIAGSGGFSLLGLSGGVPGPPTIHGTNRSGVAVNMADWIAGQADPMMLADAKRFVEIIMAHEGGHHLGLFHTTERNGQALDPAGIAGSDPLSDTPVCPDSADADGNMILSASECSGEDGGNIMFWSPSADSRSLTSNQGEILKRNPLIR